jgi:LysM repeat protein
MPGINANCKRYHLIASGDQCDGIAAKYGISKAQLLSYNTVVNAQCSNLWLGYYVCVGV